VTTSDHAKIYRDTGILKVGIYGPDNQVKDHFEVYEVDSTDPKELASQVAETQQIPVYGGHRVNFDLQRP